MCIKTVIRLGIPRQNHTVHTCAEQTCSEANKLLVFFSRQIVLDYNNAVEFVTKTDKEILTHCFYARLVYLGAAQAHLGLL